MSSIIDITCDGHVHSRLCKHATGEMEDYVVAAMNKKLRRIIFLEHFETGISYFERTWLSADDFSYYHNEAARLRAKYQDEIEVKAGVEVGLNPERIDETREFLKQYQWHRVALSFHYLKTTEDHVNMVSRRQSNLDLMAQIGIRKVVTAYFSGLLGAMDCLPVDVLCHLDAVLRHYPGITFSAEDRMLITSILQKMADKNIALEINTSGYVHRDEPYPEKVIVKEALEKGVRLVAGADAHHPEQVGRYFNRLPGFVSELV
ncbi:MAG: histidinol-phosphatase [Desulfobulbaceae bacterium]|nr:histidinol-phosphatase [Desulfobulbaceae bacterium]